MGKHYIYEIFNKKIGATNDVARRMMQQGVKEGEYRIIEECSNAKVASIREIELQKQHSYPVDRIPYWKTLKNQKKSTTPQAIAKKVANTDYKLARAKAAANTDYKAKVLNTDYKAIAAKIDYKARNAKIDWKASRAKAVVNTDYKAIAAKHEKSVLQFDKQGNFIKQWDSVKKAGIKLNITRRNIGECLRGRSKSAGGYVWKYAN